MKNKEIIADRFSRAVNQAKEAFGVQPLIELAGNGRVLIEHHQGITQYGTEKIAVSVSYGSVYICGCDLTLMHMSNEQLVITGSIHSVQLRSRRC